MKNLLLILAIFCFFPLLAAAENKNSIVVSISPQRYFIEKIAPAKFNVEVLIPATANPHTFEPTLAQLKILSKSKLYFTVGHPDLSFEKSIVEKLADAKAMFKIINTTEGITDFDEEDPHLWSSPRHVMVMVENIKKALVDLDPKSADFYEAHSQKFIQELQELDKSLQELFKDSAGKKFLVFHPAWGYFARDYHLSQISIEEHGKEPGVGHAAHVINISQIRGLKVLFVQPQTSRQSAEVVAGEINATIKELDPMREDWMTNIKSVAEEIKGSF